jgi:antitoxin MazE
MSEAILDIKRWGNSLGVRLPAEVARKAHLHADQRVRITVDGNCVVIAPMQDERLMLKRRLTAYDPKRHGGEQMTTTKMLGVEVKKGTK